MVLMLASILKEAPEFGEEQLGLSFQEKWPFEKKVDRAAVVIDHAPACLAMPASALRCQRAFCSGKL